MLTVRSRNRDSFFRAAAFFFFSFSFIFQELRFQGSRFVAAVIFSQQLLFQSEIPTELPLLDNSKFFRAVTFRNSYFFGLGIEQSKNICRRTYSKQLICTASVFLEELHFRKSQFFRKEKFLMTYFFWRATFLGRLLL